MEESRVLGRPQHVVEEPRDWNPVQWLEDVRLARFQHASWHMLHSHDETT